MSAVPTCYFLMALSFYWNSHNEHKAIDLLLWYPCEARWDWCNSSACMFLDWWWSFCWEQTETAALHVGALSPWGGDFYSVGCRNCVWGLILSVTRYHGHNPQCCSVACPLYPLDLPGSSIGFILLGQIKRDPVGVLVMQEGCKNIVNE